MLTLFLTEILFVTYYGETSVIVAKQPSDNFSAHTTRENKMYNYVNLMEKANNYAQAKKDKVRRAISPFKNLSTNFCEKLVDDLSMLKLQTTDNGKIGAYKSIMESDDPNLKSACRLAYEVSRSDLLGCTARDNPRYASLTPLLMYAHKKHHGIKYEEWDKEEHNKGIQYAIGKFLNNVLTEEPEILKAARDFVTDPANLDQVAEVRRLYLNGKAADGYSGSLTKLNVTLDGYDAAISLRSGSCYAKMLLQTWVAHPSLRVPGAMILDPYDWDKVPESLDIVIQAPVEQDTPW